MVSIIVAELFDKDDAPLLLGSVSKTIVLVETTLRNICFAELKLRLRDILEEDDM